MASGQDRPGYGGTPAGGRTAQETAGYREADYQTTDYGYTGGPAQTGLTVLAGMLMILGGLWGFFEGLIAIIHQSFYVTSLHGYTYQFNVHGWGWIHLILGVVIVAAGVCVLLGQTWAKLLGIVLAVFSGIAEFLFIPYYPIWSIIVIAMDVFIIWALASGIAQRHRAA